ncbi:bifunctional pyr operon transcriptional regulator/uracil phosphoribosyltransferase PyrR [Subtercola endophyticus]|uniref:bifunctional pyr operon transcriptional regulator/uracil phosphoribosyltransferase PyrR n=1 Tax=Subtercola endophyticus TaxID=2895559 RepID=UPI001E32D88F|nr:bifunctional pyr operon transcriptional regulator/uracil phosphoribosyltransferase PyrR [Subtercola endophyticus]UFS60290.1 bifunctional pyr operon transcriptional regulator/uracil phosphoribosyltransferase PyrR [Subtercola endophyticus]
MARVVLSQADMQRALTRISHEILESNKGAADLVILGIPTRGVFLAQRIAAIIQRIEPDTAGAGGGDLNPGVGSGSSMVGALDATMYRDDLSRNRTRTPSPTQIPAGGVDGKTVVLVDDVLYSGRTIRAALDALNDIGRPRVVRLAVLIDRGHRELPIRADFVGKNLPTSTDERINVRLAELDGVEEVSIENRAAEHPDAGTAPTTPANTSNATEASA